MIPILSFCSPLFGGVQENSERRERFGLAFGVAFKEGDGGGRMVRGGGNGRVGIYKVNNNQNCMPADPSV